MDLSTIGIKLGWAVETTAGTKPTAYKWLQRCSKIGGLNITREKATLLQHIILSHHGKMEYGSPVLPTTKEAILLSMIDDLDAKMELCDFRTT